MSREREDPSEVEVVSEDYLSSRAGDFHDLLIVGSDEVVLSSVTAVVPLLLQEPPELPRKVHVEQESQDARGSSRKRTLSSRASDA